MEDREILRLFAERDERAIAAADAQYGRGCFQIALQLLGSREDAEETVSDMWLQVWNAIPPAQPNNLFAYLSAAVRNCAIDRLKTRNAAKRGCGEVPAALDELAECIPSQENVVDTLDARMLQAAIEQFLDGLSANARTIFVERYTRLTPIAEIAEKFGISESKVKVTLMRVRRQLKYKLHMEGWI